MALSSGGPVLEILQSGKLYFDKSSKLMTYFHAVPNAALKWSHIQSALKLNSLLICSARLEKCHQHFADMWRCDRNRLLFRVERTGAEMTGQQFQEKQKPGEGK